MAKLKYTLTAAAGVDFHDGCFIDSAILKPGTHSDDIYPGADVDVAVNASAPNGLGWTLIYSIDGRNQTPEGPIRAVGQQGKADHFSKRPVI